MRHLFNLTNGQLEEALEVLEEISLRLEFEDVEEIEYQLPEHLADLRHQEWSILNLLYSLLILEKERSSLH